MEEAISQFKLVSFLKQIIRANFAPASEIVMVVPVFPQISETFIMNKFRGLQNGFSVSLVCDDFSEKNWNTYQFHTNLENLKKHLYTNPPTSPKILGVFVAPIVYFVLALCRPKSFIKAICDPSYSTKSLYFDFWYLLLNPKIIHFEFAHHIRDHLGLTRIIPTKIVGSFRGSDLYLNGLSDPQYFQPIWKAGTSFHFLGKNLYQKALQKGLSSETNYVLIPPAINCEHFHARSNSTAIENFGPDHPLKIVSVGRLHWTKGLEWALQAISLAIQAQLHLRYTIVGDGPMLEAVLLAIHTLGIESQVSLKLEVSPKELPKILQDQHVFLQASVSEGFCNAVLEAQAMGLACIVSDAGGLPESISPHETGIMVPRRNPIQMAEAMKWFYQNPQKIEEFGKAGRKRVENYFKLEDQIHKFRSWYQEIILKRHETIQLAGKNTHVYQVKIK